ncbi:AI-2E family transporter [Psychromonas sp. 14N.309.X.WAT.B.A12]|uniref:AI-2E family transporter n=1 Tax=unclassified Psychromonas TaxID=2614957 RepID=UPI0025AF7FFE|nr:AI-2E family transporter [Psychromonas sp. 14N.309.X.WAT.B.A12]MDN2662575.1 AI-2E family transporter [Psychromonas sp. 14N.309.X.WAT.B.A12]
MFMQLFQWYKTRFSDPNLSVLFLLLLFSFTVIYLFGNILTPLFVAIILAYLLDWPVTYLMRFKINRTFATLIVMVLFISISIFAFLGVLPTIFKQAASFIHDLPTMLNQGQTYILTLPAHYPEAVDPETIKHLIGTIKSYLVDSGGFLLSQSFASLLNIAALLVYAILVPLMMVFMLKDKNELIASMVKFLPDNRKLAAQVWSEMNGQIMNYIRGKITEIVIVGVATYFTFFFMDLRYSALLALLVGLSVLIPYIGAAAVTVPVALVALFQWGMSPEFAYLMIAYGIIQALDGNLIVPILFSEAVNLHPVVIIISVLIFGGLWGFWGVFFAIPLATLVKAVLNAWPSVQMENNEIESID